VKISEIKRQKKNPNRVSVYIEGKYSFSLDYDTLMASQLHVGDAVTDEKRNDLLQNDEFPRARDYAYSLLSYRDRTEYEIKDRLLTKGFKENSVKRVVSFLKERHLIDDCQFARKWVDDILLSRPMGKIRVVHELINRRIKGSIIEEVCEEKFSPGKELELARRAAEKKIHSLEHYQGEVVQEKIFRFLKNRGFDFEIIKDLMKEYFGDDIE
jgi:regulatory protein